MSLKEALDLLKQVCAGFKGTLQEHQLLQQALQVVADKSSEVKKKKPAKE